MQKRYLSPEESASILEMRGEHKSYKEIAKKFGICEATVSNVINGKRKTRKHSYANRRGRPILQRDLEPAEQDFSQLPDDVLFKHVKPWDYIG